MSFTCAPLSLSLFHVRLRAHSQANHPITVDQPPRHGLGTRRAAARRCSARNIKFVPQHGNAIHLVARNSRQVNAETIRACVEEGERVIFRTRQFQIFFEHQGRSLGVMVFEGMTLEDAIAQLPEPVRKSMDEFRFQHQGKPCSRDTLLANVGVGNDSTIVTAGRLVGGMPLLRGQGAGSSNGAGRGEDLPNLEDIAVIDDLDTAFVLWQVLNSALRNRTAADLPEDMDVRIEAIQQRLNTLRIEVAHELERLRRENRELQRRAQEAEQRAEDNASQLVISQALQRAPLIAEMTPDDGAEGAGGSGGKGTQL